MYLFLGKDTAVELESVVGIFDFDGASVSSLTRQFLSGAEQTHTIINVSYDLPKSFILCQTHEQRRLYISPVSAGTLWKRAKTGGKV